MNDIAKPTDLTIPENVSQGVALFERLAKDPNVDVEKLERLIALQERIMHHNAKAAFNAAFAKMQPKIPIIDEHGKIDVRGTVRSTYAPLEDIHAVIKPICAEHGFAIRHRTEWPTDKPGIIRIVGILSHEEGHSEETAFEAPMDKSDYRTDIQSQGSTVSYGRRYTTMDLLNISTRKADNDGQAKMMVPKAYETLPEAVKDNIDKAFTLMQFTKAMALNRLNAAFGGPSVVASEAADALLNKLRDEFAEKQGRMRVKDGNKREVAVGK